VVSHVAQRRGSSGQALIEMALVVVMLVLLVLGIAEVGWAFMRTSIITHAARDGARFGATLETAYRDPITGCFTGGGESTIENHVNEVLDTIGFGGTVAVSQGCKDTVPTVVVRVTGTLEMMFNLVGTSFDVDRSVTFEDENRAGCGCA
jgi:Flp pilus assembly protein TadG